MGPICSASGVLLEKKRLETSQYLDVYAPLIHPREIIHPWAMSILARVLQDTWADRLWGWLYTKQSGPFLQKCPFLSFCRGTWKERNWFPLEIGLSSRIDETWRAELIKATRFIKMNRESSIAAWQPSSWRAGGRDGYIEDLYYCPKGM